MLDGWAAAICGLYGPGSSSQGPAPPMTFISHYAIPAIVSHHECPAALNGQLLSTGAASLSFSDLWEGYVMADEIMSGGRLASRGAWLTFLADVGVSSDCSRSVIPGRVVVDESLITNGLAA